jgi:citrate synthase
MGIGHRVTKCALPEPLMKNVLAMVRATGERQWFDIAHKLEAVAMDDQYFRSRSQR